MFVTGSAGKTTAKDFTAELLRARGEVLATRGNLNNHLGVPLTLARLETKHWAAVIETGMSHAGELSRLARLIQPKVAVVTNVAAAHLEFFGSTRRGSQGGDWRLWAKATPRSRPGTNLSPLALDALRHALGEGSGSSIRATNGHDH
jgi:hypothetical protein